MFKIYIPNHKHYNKIIYIYLFAKYNPSNYFIQLITHKINFILICKTI